jgi:hypothetical protein
MTRTAEVFRPEDLSILLEVLETNQSLHSSAHAVKVIEERLAYPVANVDVLLEAFGDEPYVSIGNCRISRNHVQEYLPAAWFPISTRRELIGRLILAFERERLSEIAKLARAQGHKVPWEDTIE